MAESERVKELQELSKDALVSLVSQIESDLTRAHQKNKQLLHQLQEVKESHVDLQNKAEAEEELIANTLFKKLEALELQKNKMLQQVEHEEEYLTNTLQKRLSDLEKEKTQLEERLEEEQEYIVNKLQLQLDQVLQEKEDSDLQRQIDDANSANIDLLKAREELRKVKEISAKSIEELNNQNFVLSQQVEMHRQKLEIMNRQKLQLEREVECEEEKNFNLGSSPSAPSTMSTLIFRRGSTGSSPSPSLSLRSPRTSIGSLLATNSSLSSDLFCGPTYISSAQVCEQEPFTEVSLLLSERGFLLAFADPDFPAGHAEPKVKIDLDTVTAVVKMSNESFLLRDRNQHEHVFKASEAKDAEEWRLLISSLLPGSKR